MVATTFALPGCAGGSGERYGFVTVLGRDTVAVERITRTLSKVIADGYNSTRDLDTVALHTETVNAPIEKFTISIVSSDATHGSLVMEWGTFRWAARDHGAVSFSICFA